MRYILITFVVFLGGCAAWQRPYSVDDLSEWDVKYEASSEHQIFGQWLTSDTLEVVLYFPLEDENMIRAKTMSAGVVDDLITVKFDVERNPDYVNPNPDVASLCMGEKKLTFMLRGVTRKNYQVKVVSVFSGDAGAWDPKPLTIRE